MSVSCDLERVFGTLASSLPTMAEQDRELMLTRENLPQRSADLATSRIIVEKGHRDYNSWYRADVLRVYLSHAKARELGLFLLSCIFNQAAVPSVLTLTNPHSLVRRFVYRRTTVLPDGPPLGLSVEPTVFLYIPEPPTRYPWTRLRIDERQLPLWALSNDADMAVTEEEWSARDTVFLESSLTGHALLAELLLNAGAAGHGEHEFDLEGEAGYRGVAPMSAEISFQLPGALGWHHDDRFQ